MRTANIGNGNNNTDQIQKKYKEAEEPQLDADELDGVSDDATAQEEIISAELHKGNAD